MQANPVVEARAANGTVEQTPNSSGRHLLVIGSNAGSDLAWDSGDVSVLQDGVPLEDEAGNVLSGISTAGRHVVRNVAAGVPIHFVFANIAGAAANIDINVYKLKENRRRVSSGEEVVIPEGSVFLVSGLGNDYDGYYYDSGENNGKGASVYTNGTRFAGPDFNSDEFAEYLYPSQTDAQNGNGQVYAFSTNGSNVVNALAVDCGVYLDNGSFSPTGPQLGTSVVVP